MAIRDVGTLHTIRNTHQVFLKCVIQTNTKYEPIILSYQAKLSVRR